MKSFRHPNNMAKGFTLVEILIAMLIGLFLVAGVIQIFINSKQSYRVQEALARLQENGRFALDFLDRDIRMAGYRGCASRNVATPIKNNLKNTTAYTYDFSNPIQGFDTTAGAASASWNPSHSSTTTGITSPLKGSDIITIRRAADDGVQVITNTPASTKLTLSRNTVPGLKGCDVAIVSDCNNAELFQVASYDGNAKSISYAKPGCGASASGGNTKVLDQTYIGGSLNKAQTTSYYVKNNPNNRPALFRLLNGSEDELVEGVEKMQILYGLDTNSDGTAESYVAANNATTQWGRVVSVRISLLLMTIEDNIASKNQKYSYEDIVDQTATDKRIRRVFTTTVAIRNKLP